MPELLVLALLVGVAFVLALPWGVEGVATTPVEGDEQMGAEITVRNVQTLTGHLGLGHGSSCTGERSACMHTHEHMDSQTNTRTHTHTCIHMHTRTHGLHAHTQTYSHPQRRVVYILQYTYTHTYRYIDVSMHTCTQRGPPETGGQGHDVAPCKVLLWRTPQGKHDRRDTAAAAAAGGERHETALR